MAIIRPFCGIRPQEELASRIGALPYDVYNREEAKREVEKEPLSFLKIDRAETQFPDDVDTYADCVYQKAHDTLWEMVEKGQFIKDEVPCYYLYELTMNGRTQTGIVACASIDDYENGIIKKHENTRADKEADRIHHVDACDAQTGPIFLAYRRNQAIEEITAQVKEEMPIFDFTSEDQIRHRGWKIQQLELVEELYETFEEISAVYIADGHHRAASAVKVGQMRRAQHPDYTGEEEFNYFLSVLFPDEELMIMDYNRVLKDLKGMGGEQLFKALEADFQIKKEDSPVSPAGKGEFGLYINDGWYRLTYTGVLPEDPVESLDVAILQNRVLGPLFDIQDPKTDPKIDFVGGIRGLEELERRVHKDCKAAFSMYPTSIGELFAVADAGKLMPPKSTWFEPKLRSGLFIHKI